MNHRSRSRRRACAIPALALIPIIATAGCESSPTDAPAAGEAVVGGWVQPSATEGPPRGTESPSRMSQSEASGEARTVVIGQVSSGGTFQALAEADVEADGSFRIEGVPDGRFDLVVIAYAEGGAEVGSVVLHEVTRAGEEHRTHPIGPRSTLHARTFVHAGAQSGVAMGSAELALYLDLESGAAAQLAASEAAISGIASAALRAQAALDAVLAAEGGVGLDAAARAELLASLVADRDRSRDGGADARATQEAFVAAVIDAYAGAGARAEVLAVATAAAATAFDGALHGGAMGGARLELTRQAILFNLETRKRAAGEVEGNPLGLKGAVADALVDAEAAVRGAGTTGELRAGLDAARTGGKARILAAGLLSLEGLLGEAGGGVEAGLGTALAQAAFWSELETAASAEAKGHAAAQYRSDVRAAAEALVEALPPGARAGVSAEVVAALLVAFGAGPYCS